MKLILKYTIENIKNNKFISLIIIFSLIISSAVLNLTLVSRDEVVVRYEKLNKEMFQGYDLVVRKYDISDPFFYLNKVKLQKNEVDTALGMNQFFGKMDKNNETFNVTLTGINLKTYSDKNLIKIKNMKEFNEFGKKSERNIIISPKLAKNYGYKVGNELKVTTNFGEEKFKIAAIADEKGIFTGQDNEYRIVMDIKTSEEISNKKNKVNAVLIAEGDGVDLDKSIDRIESANKNSKLVASTLVDYESIKENQALISEILIIILILSIFINIFVISSNAKRVLASRIPVIGTFRSIGCSKLKIQSIVLFENFIYALIGGGIGVAISMLFKDTIIGMFTPDISNLSSYGVSNINMAYAVISILFTLILQVVSVYAILHKTTTQSIRSLIIENPTMIRKNRKWEVIIWGMLFVGSAIIFRVNTKSDFILALISMLLAMVSIFKLLAYICAFITTIIEKIAKRVDKPLWAFAMNNIKTSKTLVESVKLVATASCVILMIYMTSMAFRSLFTQANDSFTADYQLYGMTKSVSEYSSIKTLNNVKELKALFNKNVDVTVNNSNYNMLLCGMDRSDYGITDIKGKVKNLKSHEIMVDEMYMKKCGWKVGDKINIVMDEKKEKKETYTIRGIVDAQCFTVKRNVVVISSSDFKKSFSDVPSTLYVTLKNKNLNIKSELYKKISGENVGIQSYDEFIEKQEERVSGIFSIVWLIMILSLVLVIIGLVNSQAIGFLQRKRELAVLYSVAMDKAQLKVMTAVEIIFTFLISCICGLSWGAYMSKMLEKILASLEMYINISVPWAQSIGILVVMFICLIFTNIIPIRQINRMNVVKEIRYE